jgi:hypothetical protein
MEVFMHKIFLISLFLMFAFFNFMQNSSWACACGCGVFDVGTASMFPSGQGGTIWEEYDFMDQTHDWGGTSKASDEDNGDKQIRSSFIDTGFQYMFSRQWGLSIELPYVHRYFKTDNNFPETAGESPDIQSFDHSAIGDMRIQGVYTGFSPDMSTGLTFGFKVPTGDWTYPGFDRDTNIGSGSTDALLGGFHRGTIMFSDFDYFIQNLLDQPFLTQGGYRPGTEDDAALGVYYKSWYLGGVKVTPVAEVENSYRSRDRGWAADPTDSGYERILLAPGIELDYKKVMLYFDVGFPVYTFTEGYQLVTSAFYKVTVSYMF